MLLVWEESKPLAREEANRGGRGQHQQVALNPSAHPALAFTGVL